MDSDTSWILKKGKRARARGGRPARHKQRPIGEREEEREADAANDEVLVAVVVVVLRQYLVDALIDWVGPRDRV